jgi:hypothetical protein
VANQKTAKDIDELMREKPEVVEGIRGGLRYEDMSAKYGISNYFLRLISKRLGVDRSNKGEKPKDERRLRILGLPRVTGVEATRWRVYLERMRTIYGGGWWDITHWAAVAYQVRLYAGIDRVVHMLPMLRERLDQEAQRRVRLISTRGITVVEYYLP